MAISSTAPGLTPRSRRPLSFHPLTVANVDRLCDDAVAVEFVVPDHLKDDFVFKPGQALTLRRDVQGQDERRSYSICSPAGSQPRIGVREVPGGLFSSWLVNDVRPGDVIEAMTPAGSFTPDLSQPGHHVLVAAGSGITPMLSIAQSLLTGDPQSHVTLFYGNRRSNSVMFADELADIKDCHPARFQLVHVLSREPREAELLSGRLDTAHLEGLLDALVDVQSADHWWLCGPHGMVQDAQKLLGTRGVPAERVHWELFYAEDQEPPAMVRPDETQPDGPASEVSITLDGRTTCSPLPRDRSILDGAQLTRSDLPFACKGGVCGTCRALVVEGEVAMRRNFALEQAEVEAGYVLTCQSFPVSDALTVDFDT